MKIDSQTKILFGVFSTYEREGWIHPTIMQFMCDLYFNKEFAFRVVPIHNFKPAAAGRNIFAKQVKDADCDWICMIDNDMGIPGDFLDTLKNVPKDASIVVPTFYMWNQFELKLTLCWGMDNCPDGIITQMEPGFYELTKCGTGAIFIKPEVFRKLEYPYFKYLFNEDGGMYGTEDIQFCEAARKQGFKIYGNTCVRVGHYHSVDLGSMWDWFDARVKSLDTQAKLTVDSQQKAEGCSPSAAPENGVPVEAR